MQAPIAAIMVSVYCLIDRCLAAQQCPFPGVPANAYGRLSRSGITKNLTWSDRTTSFNDGDTVVFKCLFNATARIAQPTIKGQKDSTWANLTTVSKLRCDGNSS